MAFMLLLIKTCIEIDIKKEIKVIENCSIGGKMGKKRRRGK